MSQVLVGEIVFKLKADADNLVRTLRKAAAEVRALEAEQKRLQKTATENQRAMDRDADSTDRLTTSMSRNVAASKNMANANDRNTKSINAKKIALGALIAMLAKTAAKFAALASLAGLALAAIGALAGGILALTSALAPLVGSLILFPAALGAAATSMLALKAALAPVMEALKSSNDPVKWAQAIERMNQPLRDVTLTLGRMKTALDATNTIQRNLFPGLNAGLLNLEKGVPNVARAMSVLGQALGRVATYGGQVFGSRGFLADFNVMAQSNADTVERMGRGIVNFGSAFRHIFVAATPLITASSIAFETLSRKIDNAVAVSRANGGLETFFYKTYQVASQLGETIGDLGVGLRNLARFGGQALGGTMLKGLEEWAEKFRSFTESIEGQNSIREFFAQAGPALSEFGKLLGDLGRAMADFAKNQDLFLVLNKLRTELLPSLLDLANNASKRLVPALIDLATAFTNVASVISAGAIGQILVTLASAVEKLSRVIMAFPDLAMVIGAFIALSSAASRLSAIMGGTMVASFLGAARAMGVAAVAAVTTSGSFTAAARGLGAAVGGMKTATIAGLALASVLGSKMVNSWRDSKDSIREFITASESAFDPARLNFGDVLTPLREMQTELKNTTLDWYDWTFGLDELPGKLQKIGPAWLGMGDGLRDVNRAIAEQQDLAGRAQYNMAILGAEFGLTGEAVKTLAARLGIDLTGSTKEAAAAFADYYNYLGDGSAASAAFADATAVLGNELSSAEEKANALKTALAAFGDTSLQDSIVSYKDQVAQLVEALVENGTTIDENTQKGRDNWKMLSDMAGGWRDVASKMQEANVPQAEINAAMNTYREHLLQAGIDAGIPIERMGALADEVGLVQDAVSKLDGAGSLDEMNNRIDTLRQSIRGIEESDPEIKFNAQTQQVHDEMNVIDALIATARTMPVEANTAPANAAIDLASMLARTPQSMPVDANTAAGRAQIQALRTLASMGVTMPVTVRVSGASYLAEVRRDASRARNFTNANGNIYKSYANGTENHVAEIAPAGAWRVWAEDETGGEAYIPLALSKRRRSMNILKQTAAKFGANITAFAGGGIGPIGRSGGVSAPAAPTGMSAGHTASYQVSLAIGTGDVATLKWAISSAEAIQTAWERTVQQAATAASRADLVERRATALAEYNSTLVEFRKGGTVTVEQMDSVTKAANDALKAIHEFDAEQVRAGERRAFEAAQARAQAALTIALNKEAWEFERMSVAEQLRFLDRKIAAEQMYTDEWMRLQRERTNIAESEIARRNQLQEEEIRKAQDAADELASIADRLNSDYESALRDLNSLLDREADLRQQMAEEQIRHARANDEILDRFNDERAAAAQSRYDAEIAALARYNETVDSLLSQRHETLMSWARIDAQAEPLTALPVAWINSNVKEQIAQFQQWSTMLAGARQRGVSEDVIAALGLDAGPQALGQLQAMAAATDAEITELNNLVLAKSQIAGEQVAREVATRNTVLSNELIAAHRLMVDEMAEARDAFDQALLDASSIMKENLAAEFASYTDTMNRLATELANLGLDTGRDYAEAIAAGMASGLPGIIAIVNQVISLAAQAAAAAAAATNAQAAVPTYSPITSPTQPVSALPGGTDSPFRRPGTQTPTTAPVIPAAPGVAYPGAPPLGTAGTVVIAGTTYTVNTAGIIDSPGKYYGIYPAQATFDKGGILAPGLTMAYNATGRNEYINTGDQILNMALKAVENARGSGADGDISINVYLDGTLINGMARVEVNKGLNSLRREIQGGRGR